ncbi:MAG: type II toxin-antitoxin system HipA family toxin [Methylomicrobium sp.]|nr:type II toxin-antitoxin system HipA family toxin [Methylomicrobium sp.]
MQRLNVYAGNILVGHLSAGDATGMIFVYAHSWLTHEAATPLSPDIPLSEQKFQGEQVTSFFENLLPEGDVLNFISKAVHISPTNIFGLLERFGGDTAGAFSLLPDGMCPSDEPHYLPVTADVILQWFDRSRGIPLDITGEQARMSLSGAQDKMTVLIDAKGALSIPLGASPSSHIIKPSISHRGDVPNTAINEAMIMMLAREVKLDVAEVRYASELGAVIVTRYDREIGRNGLLRRLHQNDLCQVLGIPSSKKYESEGGPSLQACFKAVIERSAQPALAKKRLIEWVVFNVLVGNMDGHAKNLSLMSIGESTKLAPFYDLVCTAVYPNLSQKFAFKIGGENRPRWMMSRHWDRFAIETDTKPQFVSKVLADLIKRTESALPIVVERLQQLTVKPDERLMIETIEKYIYHSLLQMKSRLKDKTSESTTKDQ